MKNNFSIPNILSMFRILLVPVFALTFLMITNNPNYIAFAIFILASVTDFVDGFIARKFNMVTDLGKVLDPFADKLLKITVLVCFVIVGIVPLWFLIAMLVFDLTLILSASVLLKKEIIIKSNWIGKSGTAVITIGILLAFFNTMLNNIHMYILIIGLAIVFASVISYFIIYLKTKNNVSSIK